jgi:hypothetical protein
MRKLPKLPESHWLLGDLNIAGVNENFNTIFSNWRIENDITLCVLWIGPFNAFFVVADPEHLKPILKSLPVIILIFDFNII